MLTDLEYNELRENTEIFSHLDYIAYEPLKTLTEHVIKKYGAKEKLELAKKVIDLHMAFLEFKNQIAGNSRPAWIDLFIAAGYMHNMFYDGSVTSLFKAREEVSSLAKELDIPVNGISMLFSAIEGQFGDKTPVEACIPQEASPNALFAKAVFVVEVYSGIVKLPEGTSY